MFVDWQRPAVRRCDAVAVTVNTLHQPVVPSSPTGVQHRVLDLNTAGEWCQQNSFLVGQNYFRIDVLG